GGGRLDRRLAAHPEGLGFVWQEDVDAWQQLTEAVVPNLRRIPVRIDRHGGPRGVRAADDFVEPGPQSVEQEVARDVDMARSRQQPDRDGGGADRGDGPPAGQG